MAALAKSDPYLTTDVAKLNDLANAKLAELQKTIDLFSGGQRDEALKLVNTDLGRQLMDNARELFASMIARFVLFRPKRILLLMKTGVSAELTYFCAFTSGSSRRPLNATTSPASL